MNCNQEQDVCREESPEEKSAAPLPRAASQDAEKKLEKPGAAPATMAPA